MMFVPFKSGSAFTGEATDDDDEELTVNALKNHVAKFAKALLVQAETIHHDSPQKRYVN
jgi:hypothetical protein